MANMPPPFPLVEKLAKTPKILSQLENPEEEEGGKYIIILGRVFQIAIGLEKSQGKPPNGGIRHFAGGDFFIESGGNLRSDSDL